MGVGFSWESGGVLEWELDFLGRVVEFLNGSWTFLRRVVGFLNGSWIFFGGWWSS